jgi:hypothetical protein
LLAVAAFRRLWHLTDPVGNDHFARPGAEVQDVRADLVQHPLIAFPQAHARV